MTASISPSSTDAEIDSAVRSFIVTAPDGSRQLDTAGMASWLTGQFEAVSGSAFFGTDMVKDVVARGVAATLERELDFQRWKNDPGFPTKKAGSSVAVATARLVDLYNQMVDQVHALNAPYAAFKSGLAARAKALFNDTVAPLIPAGADLVQTTRAYIETFVTDWGEESKPSPVSALVTLDQNDSATINGNDPPFGRHITRRRLYRSATGTSSSAYRLQGEYPIAQTTITDSLPDDRLAEACPSFGWDEPPSTLRGLVGVANGVHAGFDGRTLYFCESYKPYTYPVKYSKPLAHNIVGLVAFGQSLFVSTVGNPYLVSGADAASMSEELIPAPVPCESARSMVAVGGSVFYASPEGLALYENGSVEIVSAGALDRAAWQAYNPASMRGAAFDGRYYAFFTRLDATRGALVFDYKTRTLCELAQGADAVFANQDGLYLLDGTAVLDLLPVGGAALAATWHSKTFHAPRPVGFSWLQLDGDGPATVRAYAGDVLHHIVTASPGQPVRFPPGRSLDWRIEIDAACRLDGLVLASTTDELKAAP